MVSGGRFINGVGLLEIKIIVGVLRVHRDTVRKFPAEIRCTDERLRPFLFNVPPTMLEEKPSNENLGDDESDWYVDCQGIR